ncbi:MAG: shikimate dehydrogenase family protein [Caulobacteraceae bacterium]
MTFSGVSGRTLVTGVVGAPVSHSLSPLIFNSWFRAAAIDAIYCPFAIEPGRFAAFANGLRGGGSVRVLNVTAPFKEEALALADIAGAAAASSGAANLLVFTAAGDIRAENFDGAGMVAVLEENQFDPGHAPVVILGAGGAARGAATALVEAGARDVRIVNRTLERASRLAQSLGTSGSWYVLAAAESAASGAGLLINTTSSLPEEALSGLLPSLPEGAVVMDMTYRPLETPLLASARGRRLRTVDGLAMLIAQARLGFGEMFARQPPELDVRALALAAMAKGA